MREAGIGFGIVIKTTVFLADMQEFAAMNEVYARYFGDHRPARSTVAVLGLPGTSGSRSKSSRGLTSCDPRRGQSLGSTRRTAIFGG